MPEMAGSLLFGPFRLDMDAQQLWRGDEPIALSPRAMDVLAYLVTHAGETVSRKQLFEALWPGVHVEDHALSVQIVEIRKALGDDSTAPRYLETRHRRGYRFCIMPTRSGDLPHTQYVDNGGVNIAYQVIGKGPVDLVFVMGWVSHLEYTWTEPGFARFLQRLGSFSRVILFDKRGTGMSDRVPLDQLPTIQQRMDDVRAVMEAVGSRKAVICGVSEGGCMSAVFAATYPERAAGLIMIGSYARRIRTPDYPWAPTAEQRQQFFDEIQRSWGKPIGVKERAPTLAEDPAFLEWWAAYLRMGASPGAALALTRMNTETDVRDELPRIRVPALVVHRTGDQCVHVEEGRYIAAQIRGSRLAELPGEDHLPFVGDQEGMLREIQGFLAGVEAPDRQVLTTSVRGRITTYPL